MLQQWLEFWDRNRFQVIGILVLVVLVFISWGGAIYYQNYRERKAAALYSALPEQGELRRQGLESIARDYPKTGAGAYAAFQLGRDDYEQKNYDQALKWYQPLTQLQGPQAMIGVMSQNNVAMIYEAQGEWKKAFEIYQQTAAEADNVAKPYAYYNMGRVAQNMGDREEAHHWFQMALEEGTGMPVADRARDRLLWLDIGSH